MIQERPSDEVVARMVALVSDINHYYMGRPLLRDDPFRLIATVAEIAVLVSKPVDPDLLLAREAAADFERTRGVSEESLSSLLAGEFDNIDTWGVPHALCAIKLYKERNA